MCGLDYFISQHVVFFLDIDIRKQYKETADKISVSLDVLAKEILKCCHIRSLLLMTKMTFRA